MLYPSFRLTHEDHSMLERIPSFDCCIMCKVAPQPYHWPLPPPAPSILDIFLMIGQLPAVCIPKDASVSFSSRTITSLTMPAGTDLSFQDHGRAAALEFSIFKREEDGITGQAVIKPPRANLHHIAWVGYLCVSALPDPTAWQCLPDIILLPALIVQLGGTPTWF